MSASHCINSNLTAVHLPRNVISYSFVENTLFQVNAHSVMLVCTRITAHRRCTLHIGLWCKRCNKI